jgi:hypothetical protein
MERNHILNFLCFFFFFWSAHVCRNTSLASLGRPSATTTTTTSAAAKTSSSSATATSASPSSTIHSTHSLVLLCLEIAISNYDPSLSNRPTTSFIQYLFPLMSRLSKYPHADMQFTLLQQRRLYTLRCNTSFPTSFPPLFIIIHCKEPYLENLSSPSSKMNDPGNNNGLRTKSAGELLSSDHIALPHLQRFLCFLFLFYF